jgi:amino acid transporter
VLGVTDLVALLVGTMLGVGIFRTPSLVAANVDSVSVALGTWLAGGLFSLVGALCYAELASAYPNTGGEYHFLTRAYGRRVGFLFAWARVTVIQTGSIALLGFVLADYLARLSPAAYGTGWWAALAIVAFTVTNMTGVRAGKVTQKTLASVEVVGVFALIVTGAAAGAAETTMAPAALAAPVERTAGVSPSLGLVMVFVLLTYGGWNEAAYVSAEVREPRRTLVWGLVASIALVTLLYVLVNGAYLRTLGLAGTARSEAPAADLVASVLGAGAAALVTGLIVVSAATSANAAIFTGARTAYALGRDFYSLRFLGSWGARTGTPANALAVQGVIALALVAVGTFTRHGFETMVEYTAPVFWLFFLLTGVSLFVLRWREPDVPRPFRVPLYPVLPLVFCATSAWLLYASLAHTGIGALIGIGVLGAGVVMLALLGARQNPESSTPSPERSHP